MLHPAAGTRRHMTDTIVKALLVVLMIVMAVGMALLVWRLFR